ncbi:MAG: ribonuclease P protein component [Pseudomonadota bacterium]
MAADSPKKDPAADADATPAGASFPRQARLTRAREFERVLRRPELRVSSGPLRVNAVFNRMAGARLGLVVGKRAVARASARNRIKRVLRERFRQARVELPDLDVVVRVVGPVSRRQLHGHIDRLFQNLKEKAAAREDSSS